MSIEQLLRGDFAPFLAYVGYSAIQPFVPSEKLYSKYHGKGLAVACDGKTLRVQLKPNGYHDRFVRTEDGGVALVYVCGNFEEQRRQNKNRAGDAIVIVLDDKQGRYGSRDRHAVLHGVFEHIVAHRDAKPDGTETLVPHSHVRLVGYETPTEGRIAFDDGRASPTKRSRVDRGLPASRTARAHHLFVDSESAAPLRRMRADATAAFPMLQLAYERCNARFDEVVHAATWFLDYPVALRGSLGNDDTSTVLKFAPALLEDGDPAADAVHALLRQLRLVTESGGYVFAHNVAHDLRQLRATMALLDIPSPALRIRAVDTVKTAVNFVPGAENRWLRLEELARLAGVRVEETLHRADADVRVLRRIVQCHFAADALASYVEEYEV